MSYLNHGQRWQIELDLRSIKEVMGMDILKCKTPEMVRKEIGMYILVYNLIRLVWLECALIHKMKPRNISFIAAMRGILSFYSVMRIKKEKKVRQILYQQLLMVMAQHPTGNRPGRVEPRAVKRRPKRYKLLLKPRKIVRQRLMTRR
ncbi:MAG: transposase [Proteobacteria bacterium]|nr:transposase [Pseudomonadota bacterium]